MIFLCSAFVLPILASLMLDYRPVLAACGQAGGGLCFAQIVTTLSVDSNGSSALPSAGYVQVNLTNTTASTLNNISVTMQCCTSNAGGDFRLADDPLRRIASLSPGGVARLYYYMTYTRNAAASPPYSVNYSFTAYYSGTSETSATFTTTQASVANAGSGGVPVGNSVSTSYLGQLVNISVTYQVGNLALGSLQIQPTVNPEYNAKCFELQTVYVISSTGLTAGGLTTGASELMYAGVNGGSSASFAVRYSFRVKCLNQTVMYPFTYGKIGGPDKYLMGSPVTITTPSNPFISMTKSLASAGSIMSGDYVTYSVAITNGSNVTVLLSALTDTLPGGMSLVGTTADSSVGPATSSRWPLAGATGTVVWESLPNVTFEFAPNAVLYLRYVAVITGTGGTYTNTICGRSYSTDVGCSSVGVQVAVPTAVTLERMEAQAPPMGIDRADLPTVIWLAVLGALFVAGSFIAAGVSGRR